MSAGTDAGTPGKTARRAPWQRFIHIVGPQGSGKTILSRQIAAGVRQERMARVDRGDIDEWLAQHGGSWDRLLAAHEHTSVFIFLWLTEPDVEIRADDMVIRLQRGPGQPAQVTDGVSLSISASRVPVDAATIANATFRGGPGGQA